MLYLFLSRNLQLIYAEHFGKTWAKISQQRLKSLWRKSLGAREQYKQKVTCTYGSENKVRITAGQEKVILPSGMTLIMFRFPVFYWMKMPLFCTYSFFFSGIFFLHTNLNITSYISLYLYYLSFLSLHYRLEKRSD